MELEFVAIKRKDTGEWALPGGMVEKGETVSLTLKKEFMEETQNILEKDKIQAEKIEKSLDKLFSNPTKNVYRGYVDDPRNTDNSWMETICTLFHDDDGTLTEAIKLEAGDDASQAQWITIKLDDPNFKLYASHKRMVEIAYNFIIGRFGSDISAALFNFTNSYFRRYT